MARKAQVNVYLPPEVDQVVREQASQAGVSVSAYIADIVDRHCADQQAPAGDRATRWLRRAQEGIYEGTTPEVVEAIHLRLLLHGAPEGQSSEFLLKRARACVRARCA
jgi:hypothetical protein